MRGQALAMDRAHNRNRTSITPKIQNSKMISLQGLWRHARRTQLHRLRKRFQTAHALQQLRGAFATGLTLTQVAACHTPDSMLTAHTTFTRIFN